jgi:hypothetical protein
VHREHPVLQLAARVRLVEPLLGQLGGVPDGLLKSDTMVPATADARAFLVLGVVALRVAASDFSIGVADDYEGGDVSSSCSGGPGHRWRPNLLR